MEDIHSPQSAEIWKDTNRKEYSQQKKTLWNVTFVLKFCVFQRHSILACSKSFVHTLLHNFTILLLFKYQKNSQLDQTCLQVASLLWLPSLKSQPLSKKQDSILPTNVHFFPLSLCSAWDNAHRLQETFLLDPKLPSNTYILLLSNADIFLSYWTTHPHHNSTHS